MKTTRNGHGDGARFDDLKARFREIGLALHLLDRTGRPVGQFEPAFALCQAMDDAGASCAEAAGELARRVGADGLPARAEGPCGCCLLAVPVHERRRLLGAAVAGFMPRETLKGQTLARLARRLRLSRRATERLVRPLCTRSVEQADDLLKAMAWVVQREVSLETARDELATLSANLASTYEELSLLYRISGSMRVTQQPADFLWMVARELLEVMNISCAVAVLYPRNADDEEDLVVLAGDLDLNVEQVKLFTAACVAPRLAANARGVLDNRFEAPPGSGLGKAIRNLIAAPMSAEGDIGVLLALNKKDGDFDSTDMKLLGSIASQSAVFLANSRLYADLQDLLMGVLHALTAAIDAKDPYTCGHSHRVSLISQRIAEAMGLPPAKVRQVYLGGLLHDVGKIGVPESTLRKAGRLTETEYQEVKRHPEIGAKILGGIRQLEEAIAGILTHHERPDGKGYPQGLKGEQVPLEGLIIGLSDSFDAMTSVRTYRQARGLSDVIEEIRRHTGTQFDPVVAEKFLALDLEEFVEQLGQPTRGVSNVAVARERQR